MANIITVGEILVEIMAEKVGQSFEAPGTFVGPFPSGAPAIFIDQAAKCGSTTMIISSVGNDGFGRLNLQRLREDGVDISQINIHPELSTGVAFVTYKPDGSRDFLYHITNAACGTIDESSVQDEVFQDCRYFHIMGSAIYNEGSTRAIQKGIQLAKKYNAKISFDPNVRKEIVNDTQKRDLLRSILAVSDIVLAGKDELFYLLGIADEMQCVLQLLDQGVEQVIIKRGSRGASLYMESGDMHIPAYPVQEVDPTGAGDCFGGTYISCINQGIEPIEAIRYAAVAGAMAVTKKGPMEGNTTLAQLRELMIK